MTINPDSAPNHTPAKHTNTDVTQSNHFGRLSPEDYMRERVDNQLSWFGKKSATNKKWHYRLQLLTLVAAASIPVITLISGDLKVRVLVAILGAVTALTAGIMSLYQFRDQWIDYRSTAESLKYEKYLFLTGAEPYSATDCFSLFVNRIESILMQENSVWRQKQFTTGHEQDNTQNQHEQQRTDDTAKPDGDLP